jgi:hypothetical protein
MSCFANTSHDHRLRAVSVSSPSWLRLGSDSIPQDFMSPHSLLKPGVSKQAPAPFSSGITSSMQYSVRYFGISGKEMGRLGEVSTKRWGESGVVG